METGGEMWLHYFYFGSGKRGAEERRSFPLKKTEGKEEGGWSEGGRKAPPSEFHVNILHARHKKGLFPVTHLNKGRGGKGGRK